MYPLGDHAGIAPASRTASAIASAALVGFCVLVGARLGAAWFAAVDGVAPGLGWCGLGLRAGCDAAAGAVWLGVDGLEPATAGCRVGRGVLVGATGFAVAVAVCVGVGRGVACCGCRVRTGIAELCAWFVA